MGRAGRCLVAGLLCTAIAGLAGCAPNEQLLLEEFFSASRLRDTTALQTIATVVFEPREQGIVRSFTITGAAPVRTHDGVSTKDVNVEASVVPGDAHGDVLGDGLPVQRTLIVTLRRVAAGAGWWDSGRWIVIQVSGPTGRLPQPS